MTDVANGAGSRLLVDVRAGDRRAERHVIQRHAAAECSSCALAVAHAASGWTDVVADVAAPHLAKTLTGRLGVVIADIANPAVPARRSALQPATARTLRACAAYPAAAYAAQALHGGARCCRPPRRVRAVHGGSRLECAPPCRHGRGGDVSDDDPETAGQGLCEIWGGYFGNNVCPVTCSMCDGWGVARAFCACMTLDDVSFGAAITGPHIHHEATACSICDISHCQLETCHR